MQTIPQTDKLKTFCFYTFMNNVLDLAIEKYKLDLEEAMYLKAIYFFRFYELRAQANMLEEDLAFADFEGLKRFSGECIKLFKKDYDKKISHQYLVTAFKKQLEISNEKEINIEFVFNGFILNMDNTTAINGTLELDKKIYEDAYYILSKFKAQNIPIELYVVLLYDIALTYLANPEIEHIINSQYMYEIITGQISTIGKCVYVNQDGMITFLQTPPSKRDFSYNLKLNVMNVSCSLKLLVSFLGDNAWHRQFNVYSDENSDEYFSFAQEPYLYPVKNTREKEYKDISMDTTIENFLSDTYREKFFRLWEYRLHKQEKIFFNKYVKTEILNKQKKIEFDLSFYEGFDVKTILSGIMYTSTFTFNAEGCFGFTSVIESITESTNIITLSMNEALYKLYKVES